MHRTTVVTVVLFIIGLLPLSVQAARISYSDLVQTGARPIPYGEVVTIHGSITDFDAPGKKFSDWLELSELSVSYTAGNTSGTLKARISTDKREWEIDLEPLPAKSLLRLELKATLRPSQPAAEKIVTKVLDGDQYKSAVANFFRAAKGATREKAVDQFLEELGGLVKSEFPAFISVSGVSFRGQALVLEKLVPLANLQENLKDLKQFKIPGIKPDMTPAQAYEVTKDAVGLQDEAARAASAFTRNYKDANEALKKALVETVSQTVTVTQSVPTTSVSISDLQKYAGIDYAALYVPDRDELRQFVVANIYYGSVDDTPNDLTGVLDHLQSRVSLSIGWCVGDLSNNQNSDIDGNNAYALGIGYRINKYFRVSAGTMKYRSKADGALRGETFYGISVDLTAFDALKGLVSK